MRCKTCDYRLWNLATRQCPECGSPFRPSDFEFAVNSVRFACPHCRQTYYGTGERGHLEPAEFDCVRCHQHIHMDQTILLPAEGVAEDLTTVAANPWLERQRRGVIKAWFTTLYQSMMTPQALMRSTPVNSSTGTALWFALLSSMIFGLTGMGLLLLFPMGAAVAGGSVSGLFIMAAMFLAPPVLTLIYLLFWTMTAHLVLKVSGPTQAGSNRTLQALCYSSAANVWSAIPCLGIYTAWIGYIWWPISAIFMLREGQRVSGRRAACAALALPVALTLIAATAFAVLMITVVNRAHSSGGSAGPVPAPFITANMSSGMTQHLALGHTIRLRCVVPGRPPLQHGLELLAKSAPSPLDPATLIAQPSNTTTDTIRIGGATLDQFLALDASQQQPIVDQAIQDLPANVVAHRVGDVVFTFHGIKWNGSPSPDNLWTAIVSPDPTMNAATASPNAAANQVYVLLANGSARGFSHNQLSAELVKQNALRLQHQLPPLPDPATVTHTQPATAAAKPGAPGTPGAPPDSMPIEKP
jgi:hypothetical protein